LNQNHQQVYRTNLGKSGLFRYCFTDNFPALGEKGREIRKVFFEQIPVKQVSPEIEAKIEALVTQILELKKENTDTHDLEAQIDTLVYELYGLDEAEIRLVEGK